MTAWIAPFDVVVVLLALGGALKAIDPADTARALKTAGLPVPAVGVRVAGAAEAVLGVWALVTGARVAAALVALSYAGFAIFVAMAHRRSLPIASCGCFGRADTPPSVVHLGVNVAAVVVAAAVAVVGGAGIGDVVGDQPLAGIPYVGLVALGVWFAFLALTALPKTMAAVAEIGGRS